MSNAINQDDFDTRYIEGIIPSMRYTTIQAAEILGCSRELIVKMCDRSNLIKPAEIDLRHYEDFIDKRKYSDSQVARLLNISHTTIYNLRKSGEFEEIPLRKVVRIPGWSIIDFIKKSCFSTEAIDFICIGKKIIRIPGWSIIDRTKSFHLLKT
jgi:hypothetical protein